MNELESVRVRWHLHRRAGEGRSPAARAARLRKRQHHQHCPSARLLRNDRRAGDRLAVAPHRNRVSDGRPGSRSGLRTAQVDQSNDRLVRAAAHWLCRGAASAGEGPALDLFPHGARPRGTMTVAAHRGLSPVRTVLDNGAVVIAKQSQTTPAVTDPRGVRRRYRFRSTASVWPRALRVADDRSWNGDAARRDDRGRARPTRRIAGDQCEPPRAVARLHVPRRRSRSHPRDPRRHRHASGVSGERDHDEAGEIITLDPSRRRQSGRRCDGGTSGRPVRPVAWLRPAPTRDGGQRRGDRSRRPAAVSYGAVRAGFALPRHRR